MPEPTTPLDLERLRKLAGAATPGPWSADSTGTVCADADLVLDVNGGEILPEGGPMEVAECYRNERPDWTERAANAAFIAAARTAVPALLAALSEAQRERDELRDQLRLLVVAIRTMSDAQRMPEHERGFALAAAVNTINEIVAAVDSYEKTQESTE